MSGHPLSRLCASSPSDAFVQMLLQVGRAGRVSEGFCVAQHKSAQVEFAENMANHQHELLQSGNAVHHQHELLQSAYHNPPEQAVYDTCPQTFTRHWTSQYPKKLTPN